MKRKVKWILLSGLIMLSIVGFVKKRETSRPVSEPWTDSQLMAPADLAKELSHPGLNIPLVYCVGPGALILGSIDTGPAHEKENLDKLKKALEKIPSDAEVVIYCGCCPFEKCPNIRPAFSLLVGMKFTHARLLNLEHNIRTDWVAKGYPSVQ